MPPLLRPPNPRRDSCFRRKPAGDDALLTGIALVLQFGIRWEMLAQETGCGSGVGRRSRLRGWQRRRR
jgi:transposase